MAFEKIDSENYMDENGDIRHISDYRGGDLSNVRDSRWRAERMLAERERRVREQDMDEFEYRGVAIELGRRATLIEGAGDYVNDLRKAQGFRDAIDFSEGGGPVRRYGPNKAEEMSARMLDAARAKSPTLDDAAEYLAATDDLLEIGFSSDDLVSVGATEADIKVSLKNGLDVPASERAKKIKAARRAAGLDPIKKKRSK